ncbi:MAG: VapC toxin family PIN domain ribonuclease [Anaerolineae bacterium]|nr:VapC toxin family PIN domain ribonuclease [Anaerolineae bacterium]
MTVYLLDINLLLALADPMHVHHEAAHRWFGQTGQMAWATCPLTENGFVRIASHPKYPNRPGDVAAVLALLRQFCAAPKHRFWPEDISLRDLLLPGAVITPGHVTDVYLLGLAVHHRGKLATLDQHIPTTTIHDGANALTVIPA